SPCNRDLRRSYGGTATGQRTMKKRRGYPRRFSLHRLWWFKPPCSEPDRPVGERPGVAAAVLTAAVELEAQLSADRQPCVHTEPEHRGLITQPCTGDRRPRVQTGEACVDRITRLRQRALPFHPALKADAGCA